MSLVPLFLLFSYHFVVVLFLLIALLGGNLESHFIKSSAGVLIEDVLNLQIEKNNEHRSVTSCISAIIPFF